MEYITITNAAGIVIAQIIVKPGQSAADAGWKVEAGQKFFRVDGQGDATTHRFDAAAGKWVESLPAIEAQLIAAVKDEAERRKMTMATPGGMKKTEYAEKRAEVMAWKALGNAAGTILAAFNLLPMTTRQTKFAHVLADSAAFGDNPADAVARFEAGMSKSAPTAQVAAREAKACSDIRKAPTAATKEAVYAAIVWP